MLKVFNKVLAKNLWTFFYSLSLTIGIYISLQELHEFGNRNNFLTFSVIIFMIYLIEIFVSWQSNQIKHDKTLDIKEVEKELLFSVNKLFLPIALYISLVGFGYYNFKNAILLPILVFTFICFFLLFTNIKAYFEKRRKAESNTQYVYDIIKFLIFFTTINIFVNILANDQKLLFAATVYTFFVSFLLNSLILWKLEKLRYKLIIPSILTSVVIAGIFALLNYIDSLNQLESTLILTVIFYIFIAGIHHIIHKTLTASLAGEYILIVLVIISIAYGIN